MAYLSPTGKKLTKTQVEVVLFLQEFFDENDAFPTVAELAARFCWVSNNSADSHLWALCRKGVIERRAAATARGWRFARLNGHRFRLDPMPADSTAN